MTVEDHDLLITLHEQVKQIRSDIKNLKDTDIKGLRDDIGGRLGKVESTKLAATDFISFLENQGRTDKDFETRIRFLERYVWIGIALTGIIEPILIAIFIKYISK